MSDHWHISIRKAGGSWRDVGQADEIKVDRGDGYDVIRLDYLMKAVQEVHPPPEEPTQEDNSDEAH